MNNQIISHLQPKLSQRPVDDVHYPGHFRTFLAAHQCVSMAAYALQLSKKIQFILLFELARRGGAEEVSVRSGDGSRLNSEFTGHFRTLPAAQQCVSMAAYALQLSKKIQFILLSELARRGGAEEVSVRPGDGSRLNSEFTGHFRTSHRGEPPC